MRKTALHQNHVNLGAKMGEFAGYDMPLYYDLGVMKEHLWVRESCGIFDVSHMGQVSVKGAGARAFIEKITPSSFEKLGENRTKYSVLTNEQGGIIDDLMITKINDEFFFMVINAGCKDKDIAWMKEQLPEDLEFSYYDDWALIALQGQKAEEVMREVVGIDLSEMRYMSFRAENDGEMFISRLGYTGEDGFEIAVKNEAAPALWDKLVAHDAVQPIGLAARDSLRLEMGYALYGHDITAETSPVEGGIGWVIGKNASGYFGEERIKRELAEGAARKFVGVKLTSKGVAREGSEIRNKADEKIGELTSGGHSPMLGYGIGQGYVETAQAEAGTEIFVNVRGRNIEAQIVSLPHMPARTKTAKKKAA